MFYNSTISSCGEDKFKRLEEDTAELKAMVDLLQAIEALHDTFGNDILEQCYLSKAHSALVLKVPEKRKAVDKLVAEVDELTAKEDETKKVCVWSLGAKSVTGLSGTEEKTTRTVTTGCGHTFESDGGLDIERKYCQFCGSIKVRKKPVDAAEMDGLLASDSGEGLVGLY